ncbi:RES family NAD+ phosphorylase [Curtobacterium sp. MCSS17_016]|uniref:RES family NAD+ phosphorylase n=1 Tax=Curtobacterium sp. MCSS17_016 TaxID=2175644 RepID=UPI001C64B1ED|nr:RES family NAD+ phosphorylase [Curtobacterium sp. MCSS17_016]WIE78975.1 RES family NAD+ phosphorylase [Curtobacterium sp. MCSS17_016]
MIAHNDARPGSLDIVAIDVEASGIVDLRDASALEAVGIDLEDGLAPWQADADARGAPRSWMVRDRLIEVGANGLIDPSRKSPGHWHLVLFRWNMAEAPSVRLLDTPCFGQ